MARNSLYFSILSLKYKPIYNANQHLFKEFMETKVMSEKQSLEIIAAMINRTRKRLDLGEGNIFLFWGYLCIAVAVSVTFVGYLSHSSLASWLWFLIPIVGIPVSLFMQKRRRENCNVISYTDTLSASLWRFVLYLAIISIATSFGFMIAGFNIWVIMMIFGLFVIGFATAMQGMIIREASLIIGGGFGVLTGGFLCSGMMAGATHVLMTWSVPLFILTYLVMFIVPGYILNYKAKKTRV